MAEEDEPSCELKRKVRLNCGKGGACAQLAAVAELIWPDLNTSKTAKPQTKDIPKTVPVNAMAPLVKQR